MFALPEHYFDPGAPIAFDQHTRSWPLSAYDDVFALFTDRTSFTGGPAAPTTPPLDAAGLQQLQPSLRELAAGLLDDLPTGRFDLAPAARRLAQLHAPDPDTADNAAAAIGNCLLFLSHHGKLADATADAPRLAHAVDEVLRWYPPVPVITRTALHEITIGQAVIPAGATVTGRVSAANRDPKRFTDPASFDITRQPNQHLSFGRGPSYHPGAALIRVQMAVMASEAARRLPTLRPDTTEPLQRHPGDVHYLTRAIFTTQ
jgi:cytochrome P450